MLSQSIFYRAMRVVRQPIKFKPHANRGVIYSVTRRRQINFFIFKNSAVAYGIHQ